MQNNHADFQFKIEALHSQNRQLETDLQRLQAQQRNNQSALNRLDDYEETISQLQQELHQLRSNKKKENCTDNNTREKDRLMNEEKIKELQEKFEQEKQSLLDQLHVRDEQIDKLQQWKDEQIKDQLQFDEEHRDKELHVREMLERRLIELSEDLQTLEADKHELEQQLQSKDRLIQTFQVSERIYSWIHCRRTEYLTIRLLCHASELHHDTWLTTDDGCVIR